MPAKRRLEYNPDASGLLVRDHGAGFFPHPRKLKLVLYTPAAYCLLGSGVAGAAGAAGVPGATGAAGVAGATGAGAGG